LYDKSASFRRDERLFYSPGSAAAKVLSPKRIGVTTLTFQGHELSSVTWSVNSNPHRPVPSCFSRQFSVRRAVYPQYITDDRQTTDGHNTVA